MTLLALPTYREGFPYVPMEAAALELRRWPRLACNGLR